MTPVGIWQTVIIFSLGLLVLHGFAALTARDPRVVLPHGVAWTHDVLLLIGLAAGPAWAARRWRRWAGRADRIGCFLLVFAGMLLSMYPLMLQVLLAAPANFLETDFTTTRGFVRDYLGIQALWPAAVALVAGLLAPKARFLGVGRGWMLSGGAIALLGLLFLGGDSPNPVVFGIKDSVRQMFSPRSVPRIRTAAVGAQVPSVAAGIDETRAVPSVRYDHVLFAVLEGVCAADFEAGFMTRSGGFFDRHRDHARYFSRYYTTNLDSYTSLIAMTTSIQVPFRAYAAPERFSSVNEAPNLVKRMRAAGFRTLFVSTYEYQPYVPNPQDWERILDRRDLGDLDPWVSLGSNRMEAATEDRAALPTILDHLKSSGKSFVLAELVFGHSPEWRAKTGMTPLEYYDTYLNDMWERLSQAWLASSTLLVVVSDHGDRTRTDTADNYRVPLLVVGDAVSSGEDRSFLSHLDLSPIVSHFLSGTGMPPAREKVAVVGSTERWIYGEIRESGEYAFIDDASGRVLTGTLDPSDVHDSFQADVDAFSRRYTSRVR